MKYQQVFRVDVKGWKEQAPRRVQVELTIDINAIVSDLAVRVANNRTGKSRCLNGTVQCKLLKSEVQS